MNTAERLQCWREIFDTSPQGFFVARCSPDGPLLHANGALVELLRYASAEEYIRAGPRAILPDDAAREDIFARILREESVHLPRIRFLRQDGTPLWCDMLVHLLRDEAGAPSLLVGIVEDISDRMAVEQRLAESEERLRIIESSSPDTVFFQDTDLRYRWIIPILPTYSAGDMVGRTDKEILTPADAARLTALKQKVIETRREVREQIWVKLRYGQRCFDTIYIPSLERETGQVRGVVGYARDITVLKEAEAALAGSREEARILAENVPDVVYMLDADGRITFIGPQIEGYGFQRDSVLGRPFEEFIHPEDRRRLRHEFERNAVEPSSRPVEFRLLDAQGREVWFEERGRAIRDAEGRTIKIIGTLRDVSERKALEAERRRLADLYRALAEGSPDHIFVVDRVGRYLYANRRLATVLGTTPERMIGRSHTEFYPPERIEHYQRRLKEIFETGLPIHEPEPVHIPEMGGWMDVHLTPVTDAAGGVVAVQGFARDITAIKTVEAELRRAHGRLAGLERIVAQSPAVAIRWRIAARWPVEYVSANFAQLGYEAEALTSGRKSWLEIVHPEDLERGEREIHDYIRRGEDEFVQEYRIVTKAGGVRWIEDRSRVVRDEAGKPTHIDAILLDVTDRRAAEAALRESESRFRRIYHDLPIPTMRIQMQAVGFVIVDCNRASEDWTDGGIRRLCGRPLSEIPFPPQLHRCVALAYETKGVAAWEGWYDLITAPVRRYVHMAIGFVPPDNVLCHAVDLTPQRLAEDALHATEARFRAMLEGTSDCVSIFDEMGRYVDINRAALRMTGGVREEILGKTLREAWPGGGEQVDLWARRIAETLRTGRERRFEDRTVLGDVTHFTETVMTPIRDAAGRISAVGTILRDVSEQRRLQGEIRRLADCLLEAQETERKELSGLLHDHLGQILTLLRFEVEAFKVRGRARQERLDGIMAKVDAALSFVRNTAVSLRPPALDQLSADAALEALALELRKDGKLDVRLAFGAGLPLLDAATKTCLYRVLQEALNNVVRHARARAVTIALSAEGGYVTMEVRDDGAGFDAGVTGGDGHIGLIAMRERVQRLGGALAVESAPGRGTAVRATLPAPIEPTAGRGS